jgi:competence protein ComEC
MVYVAGLLAGGLLRLPPAVMLPAVALIVLSQIILLVRGRAANDVLLFAAVFLIGGYQRERIEAQNQEARERLALLEKQVVLRVEGRLASTERSYPTRLTYRLQDCVIRTSDGAVVEFPTAIQLVCNEDAFEKAREAPPAPGDRVAVDGRLVRPPDLSNPDVFNYRAYLERNGIGASLFVRRAEAVEFLPPDGRRSLWECVVGAAERLRRWIEAALDGALEPEIAALNRSIFLGEAEHLDQAVRNDFTRCGLAHLFAVSGLNVALLAWTLSIFVRLFGPKPKLRSLLLIIATGMFCAVCGFQASVLRAAIMFVAVAAVPHLGYKIEPLTALAASALVIVGADPRALWQAGFQLSFVCMLSIILLKPPLDNWVSLNAEKGSWRRRNVVAFLNRHVVPGVTMILAAQLGLLPLLAHYYHMAPLVGVLSNVLAGPLVWLIMATTMLLLSVFAFMPAAVWIFGEALNLFSHLLLELVWSWSHLPAVTISTPDWPVWVSGLYYLLLFGWAVLPHAPSPFFELKQRARLLLAGAAIVAWMVWAPAVLRGRDANLCATFFDVGQGDSCLLEMPGGPVILVDGGDVLTHAGDRIVAPFLEGHGIDRLDAVIATHPDSDHIGGLPDVFRAVHVGWLVEGPGQAKSLAYQRLIEAAEAEAARHDAVFAGDWIEAPMGARLLVLHPPRGLAYAGTNDLSLAFMVDWKACRILIVGDIERAAESDLLASRADLACDVFKVSHHGSALATSQAFLDGARPRLAVISCGRDNRFGHPAPEVLDRLTSAGVTIARTDRNGAVTIRSDGRTLEWRCEGK